MLCQLLPREGSLQWEPSSTCCAACWWNDDSLGCSAPCRPHSLWWSPGEHAPAAPRSRQLSGPPSSPWCLRRQWQESFVKLSSWPHSGSNFLGIFKFLLMLHTHAESLLLCCLTCRRQACCLPSRCGLRSKYTCGTEGCSPSGSRHCDDTQSVERCCPSTACPSSLSSSPEPAPRKHCTEEWLHHEREHPATVHRHSVMHGSDDQNSAFVFLSGFNTHPACLPQRQRRLIYSRHQQMSKLINSSGTHRL